MRPVIISRSEAAAPDMSTVEALCMLQLVARRLGCTIRVHGASEELRELIAFAGLDNLLLGRSRTQCAATAAVLARNEPAGPDQNGATHAGKDQTMDHGDRR